VKETAIATLNSIIRSTSLAEVAQSKEISAKSERRHLENLQGRSSDVPVPSAPLFFDKVHDEFISKLHDNFMERYGIDVCNIRIESFKIMNQELSNNISKQAFTTAQTETQLANLSGQTEIATAQQKRDAEVARIRAEGEALKLKTETDAKNRVTMESAKVRKHPVLVSGCQYFLDRSRSNPHSSEGSGTSHGIKGPSRGKGHRIEGRSRGKESTDACTITSRHSVGTCTVIFRYDPFEYVWGSEDGVHANRSSHKSYGSIWNDAKWKRISSIPYRGKGEKESMILI
jgi:hypothetical protein